MITTDRGPAPVRSALRTALALGAAAALIVVLGACSGGPSAGIRAGVESVRSPDEVAVVSVRVRKDYRNELGEPVVETATDLREAMGVIVEASERQARRAAPPFGAASAQVRDSLFGPVRAAAPFSLLPESRGRRASAVAARGATADEAGGPIPDGRASLFATPDGYRPLGPTAQDSARLRSLFGSLPPEADGVLLAETTYALVPGQGRRAEQNDRASGTRSGPRSTPSRGDTVRVGVTATVRVRVVGRGGNTALTVAKTGRSGTEFAFVYGQGWTKKQISGPTRRATAAALEKITEHFRENVPERRLAGAGNAGDPGGASE